MKRLMAAGALVAALAACHDDHFLDSRHEVLNTEGPWYVQYGNGHPLAAATGDPFILSQEAELLTLINNHRVAIGVPALIDDGRMRDVARAHSIHMAIGWFEDTINPEGDDPGDRADLCRIPWTLYSENIAYGTWMSTPWDAYEHWLADWANHDTIDDPSLEYAGVGHEHDVSAEHNHYWTMDFRRP